MLNARPERAVRQKTLRSSVERGGRAVLFKDSCKPLEKDLFAEAKRPLS